MISALATVWTICPHNFEGSPSGIAIIEVQIILAWGQLLMKKKSETLIFFYTRNERDDGEMGGTIERPWSI